MDLANTSAVTYLSVFGVVILFLCVVLILTKRALTPIRPEKIKAFGVELEVSVLTLLVLVGFALSVSSIYLHINGYQQQVASSQKQNELLNNEIELTRRQLEAAKKIDMIIYFRLPGNQPIMDHLTAEYFLHSQPDKRIPAEISKGIGGNSYSILFKSLTPDTFVDVLRIKDGKTKQTWVKENFFPLNPIYDLRKEEDK